MSFIEPKIPINACLKVWWVGDRFPYLSVMLAAASGGSKWMEMTGTPAAERSVTAATGGLAGQLISACPGRVEVVECVFLRYSAWVGEALHSTSRRQLATAHCVDVEIRVTFGSLAEVPHLAGHSAALWGSKEESLVQDSVALRMAGLENPSAESARGKSGLGQEAVVAASAAAAEFAAAEDDGPAPCNAEPTPSLHLVGFLRPYQQIPMESYTEGFHR